MNIQRLLVIFVTAILINAPACASAQPAPETVEEPVARTAPDFSQPPSGFSRAEILGVAGIGDGAVVLLGSEERETMLPIFISPNQAIAIDLRVQGRRVPRPMTHDLLENVLGELNATIGKVQVHSLQGSTFIATIFLVTESQAVIEVDARPSDAIALAAGRDIPIYVSDQVLDDAGLTEEDLEQMPRQRPDDLPDGSIML